MSPYDSVVEYADAYLQLTVPSFEFPRPIPPSVHFVGALPIIPNQAPLPSWAHELDGSRKVVLVTQGTLANHDFGLLVAPTLAALANEPDLLVVVTAGGRPVGAIPGPIPGNARLASYLPFEWVLPKVDVFVTNGGYGSVNQAMSFGIPIVAAGLTEDKADGTHVSRGPASGSILRPTNRRRRCFAKPFGPSSINRNIGRAPRQWLPSSAGSTRDPKSSGSSTKPRIARMMMVCREPMLRKRRAPRRI
jgi:UDP-glucoronosyl and UDP-glucosyl transferase